MELHHITRSDLESYYLGTFHGMELAMLEEHLLWCTSCAERLTDVEAVDAFNQGRSISDRYCHG